MRDLVEQLTSVQAEIRPAAFQSVLAPTTGGFEVTDVSWRLAGSKPGLLAAGTVTNNGPKQMRFAFAIVFCFGSSGSVLGYTYTTLENLAINQPTTFETATYSPPLQPRDCATFKGFVLEGVEQN